MKKIIALVCLLFAATAFAQRPEVMINPRTDGDIEIYVRPGGVTTLAMKVVGTNGYIIFDHNVGVGITPVVKFHTANTALASNDAYLDMYKATTGYASQLVFRKSNNDTVGSVTATVTNDELGRISFKGVNLSPAFDEGADILAIQNGDATGSTVPTDVIFRTWGDSGVNSNQLVLHHDGNVGIKKAPGTALDVSGVGTFSTGLRLGTLTQFPFQVSVANSGNWAAQIENTSNTTGGNGLTVNSVNTHPTTEAFTVTIADIAKLRIYGNGNSRFDGNVGFGAAPGADRLHIASSSINSYIRNYTYSTTNSDRSILTLIKSDSDTIGTIAQADSGDLIGQIMFLGVGNTSSLNGSVILVEQTDDSGVSPPTKMTLNASSTSGQNTDQLVLASNSNIGIDGQPNYKLHMNFASVGTADALGDDFVIEGGGDRGMSILTGTNDIASIFFGDSVDTNSGYIKYNNNSSGNLSFGQNGVEVLNFTGTGKSRFVGVHGTYGHGRILMGTSPHGAGIFCARLTSSTTSDCDQICIDAASDTGVYTNSAVCLQGWRVDSHVPMNCNDTTNVGKTCLCAGKG